MSDNKHLIANQYTDVTKNDYYYEAALSAYNSGLIPAPLFSADTPCTRSMTVMYLWKAAGSPIVPSTSSFSDVPKGSEYAQAVDWAIAEGITTGTTSTTFSPDNICTRGEIVTFLHRSMKNY